MSTAEPCCLYDCVVAHHRFRPRRHQLRYRVFSLLIDLDAIKGGSTGVRLLSYNRANVFSVYESDHGDGAGDLVGWARNTMTAAGLTLNIGRIRLLTFPRIFGYVFNPISIYFCDDPAGRLGVIIYEVNNTFGQRHFYVLRTPAESATGLLQQECQKSLYVSPFNDVAGRYHFRTCTPGDRLFVAIEHCVAGELVLTASQKGRKRVLTDRALMWTLLAYPCMTVKVMAAIHWEALKIWWKRVPLCPRPLPPGKAITVNDTDH